MIRILTAVVAVWAFAYLVGAFVAWDFDPGKWVVPLRVFIAFAALAMSVPPILIINDRSNP